MVESLYAVELAQLPISTLKAEKLHTAAGAHADGGQPMQSPWDSLPSAIVQRIPGKDIFMALTSAEV